MSSFNVVQVIPALESGGVERGTVDVANYLAELKIHNSIISNGGLLENELNQEFIDHLKLPVHSKNPLFYFNLAKKIQEYIQLKKINLVHVRSRAPAWIVNMMNKKDYKSIATFHNIYSGDLFLKKMYNAGLAKMDYIISISDFVKNEIIKKYEKFIQANGIEIAGIEYVKDKNGIIYTYDVNTNTNYNSQAERNSKIKGMKSIAEFLKKELLSLSNVKVVA